MVYVIHNCWQLASRIRTFPHTDAYLTALPYSIHTRHWGILRLYIQCWHLLKEPLHRYKSHIGRPWRYEIKMDYHILYIYVYNVMCPSFIHHMSTAQDLSNGVCILVYLTLVFSSIDFDHSSHLFSVNTVIRHLYYVQITTKNNTHSDTTICLLLCKVFIILPTYAYFQYVSVVNRPSSMWMT